MAVRKEHKISNGKVKSSSSRSTALLAAVTDILLEIDIDKKYKWMNKAGYEFYGKTAAGKKISDYLDDEGTVDAIDSLLRGDKDFAFIENWHKRKDGQKRLLSSRFYSRKNYRGKIIGVLSSAYDITDTNNAENSLRQSEERFSLIAEYIDEVFWVSESQTNKVLYVSPAFERVWGFPPKYLFQSTEYFVKSVHPEDRERVFSIFELEKKGLPIEMEYRIIRPDGSMRQIWDRGYPIPDQDGQIKQYVGVAQDITKWRQSQEELNKSKEYLNQIINCIGDPLFVKDRQHRMLFVNDANCAMADLRREEMVGKTLFDVLPKEMSEAFFNEEEHVFETGKPLVTVTDFVDHVGRHRMTMVNKTLLTDNEGNKQIVGIIRDISDLKKAEKDRAELEIQLRQAQKLEAIGQLAAGIAHEINTPTQYVSDNTRFLEDSFKDLVKALELIEPLLHVLREGKADSELPGKVNSVLAEIDLKYLIQEIPQAITQSLEGLNRISTIVRAMKEFSHPGGEEKQLLDINHAITNTITVCRNEWKYVAEVTTNFDPTLPLVPCLPGDFNQVILNLIVNAAHAIAEKNGKDNTKGMITISTLHNEDWAKIQISDTGTGIPEEHRNKLFTPFFTTKPVGKGTGQGLAITRSVIVGKHNGTIEYETEVGKGTTFIICLPLTSGNQ
jgi:PAS domain S-box-containing protein